ncbi:RNA polymerase sigma factor, partial [Singulisphaera rosea]
MKRDSEGALRPHLQTLFSLGVTATLTDGQLLERFATLGGKAAESAFDAIVERHAPMVFHTCRGILTDEHEALDAFQATFLVLLR